MKKVLIFVTNHGTLGTQQEKNGTYAPEITHAIHEFTEAGLDYEIASIQGGSAPIYGDEIEDGINEAVLKDDKFVTRVNNTIPYSQLNMSDYDAVFYPGGFGLLYDLAENTSVADLVAKFYESGKPVGAVCHGPAGFLPVTLSYGSKLLGNKHVTGFSREEEVDYGTIDKIPYLLEESLARGNGIYSKVAPWKEYVIVDGHLISGQNPASAAKVGREIISLINQG